ncbi:extracellular solute-binding protein [Thalassobacillus hwangdonensis]|uniref:Extracellular solute-binding protein n=1 Tax=Thalassobacillus hwangdonensis TaxID=546108 RepID=A0ABW3L2M5_9BACI
MKKWLSLFLITSALLLLVVGCSGNDSDSSGDDTNNDSEQTDGEDAASGEKTVINFAAQNDNTPATQAVIDAFNESQDQYEVKWEQMTNDSGQMHDQLLTTLSSGSSKYDVISLDVVWAGEFAGGGYIEPIDVMMSEDEISMDDYNAGSMTSGNFNGKQYTLPFFPDLGLLYFRNDIVSEEDQATLVSGDYTYEDLLAMSEKYAGEGDTQTGIAYQSKQYEGLTVNATEFTNQFQDTEKGLEMMYNFTSSDAVPDDILNYTEGETHTAFENGNAVFARNWPYMFGRLKNPEESGATVTADQVGVAPLPNGGAVGGWLLSISATSENKEGAWEFVKFLSGEEGQKIMATEGGYLPGYQPLLDNEEVKESNELLAYEGFQNALKETIARPVSPEYSKASNEIQIAVHKYLSSGEGLDEAVEKVNAAVGEQ